jgi:A/G-specific adenine glycosylase
MRRPQERNPGILPPEGAKGPQTASLRNECDGHVLLVRRPDKGLLGGMRALPSNGWTATDPALSGAPIAASWRDLGTVPHVFTHFSLDLRVVGTTAAGDTVPDGQWWPIAEIGNAGLPTLFARAASRAIAASESIQETG